MKVNWFEMTEAKKCEGPGEAAWCAVSEPEYVEVVQWCDVRAGEIGCVHGEVVWDEV